MGQVTSRVSDELEAALTRWAAEDGRQRADLIREILAEAVDAHNQGRAMFAKPESLNTKDIQEIAASLREQQIELKRILDQNIKRDAALVRSAKEDTLGVSEARTAIVSQLAAELQHVRDALLDAIARLPGQQADALTASPAFAAMATAVEAQEKALRDHSAAATRWFEQPRTHTTYTVWDKDWSGRRIGAALLIFWAVSVWSYFGLAMLIPSLGVRSANHLLGGGDQAICALVNYRMATDGCQTRLKGKALQVKVQLDPAAKTRK